MRAEFIDLSRDTAELSRMLQELRLTEPGDIFDLRMLSGGVSSSIFRIDLRSGPVCVKQALPTLKVDKEWHAPTSRVLAEIDWLEAAQSIVPGHVPRVLGADRERGAFVMEFLPGLGDWKTDLLAGTVDLQVGTGVAEVLGRIHRATALDATASRRFANDANFFALRLEPYLIETARVHPDLAKRLIAIVHLTQNTNLALVHGDVSPKNIMIGPEGPVLLDAECAWYGDPAFDLAFLLNHAILKAAHLPPRQRQLRALYERIVSTYLPYITWESSGDFEARCAQLLPALLLARIDGKSPVEYLDEATRVRLRAAARVLLASPRTELVAVFEQWESCSKVSA